MANLAGVWRKQVFNDIIRIPVPGTPQQVKGFRIPPGARAVVRRLPANTGAVYIAPIPNPKSAALTPFGCAFVLAITDIQGIELEGQVLSQYFVDSENANDGVQIQVYLNVPDGMNS